MKCEQIERSLDDYFDKTLSAKEEEEFTAHLAACPRCQALCRQGRQLLTALRELPAPSPPPGFQARVFSALPGRGEKRRPGLPWLVPAGAMAALLLVWLLVAPPGRPPAGPSSGDGSARTVRLNEISQVKLLVESGETLEGVVITITLPAQLALAGYPQERRISFVTSLAPGNNLLTLPLIGTGKGEVTVAARIDHGAKSKELKFDMQVLGEDHTGALEPSVLQG
ncbi:anti-sigma factor family protein [Thiovibrio sp. JS02]